MVIRDVELHGPILDLLCDIFRLSPPAPWWAALRVRWLPRVPERITLVNPEIWRRTLQAFRDSTADEADCRHAASQLLLDIWLYLTHCIDSPKQSPFAKLTALTRSHDSACLKVAHCLRDIAYGDESRTKALTAMIQSDVPGCRQLFRRAFWID